MKIKLPQYSGKDYLVLAVFVIPFTLAINFVILRSVYVYDARRFIIASSFTGAATCIDFILCGAIAVFFKKKFSAEEDIILRLASMIICFLILTGMFLSLLFRTYNKIHYYHYNFNKATFTRAYIGMGIANVFLTFLHEGISRYETWKINMKENDKLRKANRQSRLQGLKNQVNPHFLFNSLNTLSSLINEEEEEAEKFLNELSKVYRYMLKNDDDHLVSLSSELKFINSYYYLLKARFGEGLKLSIDLPKDICSMWLPPLALQTVIESAFTENIVSKEKPLHISVQKGSGDNIVIQNNIQNKIIKYTVDEEYALDNLVNKYELLNNEGLTIKENTYFRVVSLPLFKVKEEVTT
jgi:sensor histidine kinase YesM